MPEENNQNLHAGQAGGYVDAEQRHEQIVQSYRNAAALDDDARAYYGRMGSPSLKMLRNIFGAYPDFLEQVRVTGETLPRVIMGDQIEAVLGRISDAYQGQNAESVRVAPLDFEGIMPGYRPSTRIYLISENFEDPTVERDVFDEYGRRVGTMPMVDGQPISGMTIMHVVEQAAAGAPADSVRLYMWKGGREYYQADERRAVLNAIVGEPREISFDDSRVVAALDQNRIAANQHPMPLAGGFIGDEPEAPAEPEQGQIDEPGLEA